MAKFEVTHLETGDDFPDTRDSALFDQHLIVVTDGNDQLRIKAYTDGTVKIGEVYLTEEETQELLELLREAWS